MEEERWICERGEGRWGHQGQRSLASHCQTQVPLQTGSDPVSGGLAPHVHGPLGA